MRKSTETVTGIIRVSQKGTGFVRLFDNPKEAIEIDYESMNTALQGDTVKIILTGKNRYKKPAGKVIEVIKRSKRGFAGALIAKDGEFALKPSDPKMYTQILIPKSSAREAKIGDKVFVTITKWTNSRELPVGQVEKVLGRAGEHEAEMQGIILERGFDSSFPPDVEREAENIKENRSIENEVLNRRDMRGITTFTIDPIDAKDFDDALSFSDLPNGKYEIGIHIADVSHYVVPGTRLDQEALERATSVYLVDRTIPMLPEILSNDLCSLNPNEDKLTFSAVFEMDKEGVVSKEWFGRTIINSDKRFSYEEAQKTLDVGTGEYFEELKTLNEIAKKLTAKRVAAGAILMETDEVKFKLDETGKPLSVYIKERGDTNKLIEEFMLLANRSVALYGSKDADKKDRLFIYRIHDEPDKDKIKDLKEYLRLLGYTLNETKGKVLPQEFNRIIKELEGEDERNTIQSVIIRSMQKAVYSIKNLGHYGLAFPFYTHFTSPIRRYPDIIAHRLLEAYLKWERFAAEQAFKYQKMAEHCSEREVEAAEAERSSVKYKQVEYMSTRIGEEFDGVVTGFTEWGLYVAEKTTRAEGLIKLRDIAEDNYTYDEKKFVLRGLKSSKIMRIGDNIRIKVKSVDVERQMIDYELLKTNAAE